MRKHSVEITVSQIVAVLGFVHASPQQYFLRVETPHSQKTGSCPDNLCYCTDSSIPFSGWQTNYADYPALTHDLRAVGVFHGRSIGCTGSDCQIFAKDTSGNLGVAKKVGNGRLLAWGDEWVTYTSQWNGDPGKMSAPDCAGETADKRYNVPQFWYNVFRWVAQTSCLTIVVPPTAGTVPQIVY